MPKRAGFWIRFVAAVIDLLLFAPVLIGLSILYVVLVQSQFERQSLDRYIYACLAVAWLMYSSMEFITRGTLGKILLGLRILRADGEIDNRWRPFLRWLTKQWPVITFLIFELTLLPVFYFLYGYGNLLVIVGSFAVLNDDKLSWHDQWAGTAVYHWRLAPAAGHRFEV